MKEKHSEKERGPAAFVAVRVHGDEAEVRAEVGAVDHRQLDERRADEVARRTLRRLTPAQKAYRRHTIEVAS